MNKFEAITVVHLESSDYIGETLNPAIEQETDTADMVIYGDKVIKNRVHTPDIKPQGSSVKTFRGLSLESGHAFQNISTLINAAFLISTIEEAGDSELSDSVLIIASQYAEAAHEAAS
ncbi:hypothetical protein LVO39_002358 [Salmonella enterica]|uniref:Uncharacterized protein n=1 Tax=Salmonella enterica subsp. enterica serovar Rough O:d:1,7 TaxID=1974323 RepID=A0A974KDL8_SALET|nr:hypothetical protein [Salmonella enterica]ECD7243439.1 hypothetical protein [Salmonella enterica subsp. enterica serovar Florida]EBT7099965.1 hypothetical protein [Salmonella enterica]ECF4166522.1 hypothetical protein [Salmonella enterica subsp. enterica serovar Florida]ECW2474267.1 hypothetical protein [Salmonella enterica subsp. enterica serovar Florida]EIQ6926152.1 hypothetical protein [Salmonella enterica]